MGRYATLLACSVIAASVLLTAASASAQTEVIVLGVRAIEGDDDFARNLTGALRHEASQVPDWNVTKRRVSLAQMSLAHGCNEPDAGCMTKVAETLEVDSIIYGTVQRTSAGTDYNFSLSLYFFNANTGSIERSVADDIPRVQSDIDNLRSYARRYVSKFSSQQGPGSLRIDANVGHAKVRLDGEEVGTTDEDGTFVAQGLEPGRHRVEISAEGHGTFRGAVNLSAGQQTTIETELQKTGTAAPDKAEDTVAADSDGVSWYTYLTGVTTLASAGVLAYAGGRTLAIKNGQTFDLASEETPQSQTVCKFARTGANFDEVDRNRVLNLCDEGDRLHILQWTFGITTAVAGAATVYFLYSDLSDSGDAEAEAPPVVIVPSVGPDGASVDATVRF